ncbi:MAG: amidohydrolase family protein [Oscillospiraceae bacterium]|nr:amidohydrolase family protein [Oscillospiraceae bacterium]
MPTFLGIPLHGWIQMMIGAAVGGFFLVKYLVRPKRKNKNEYIIKDVHIIVGDGTELFRQNVYVKDGIIKEISQGELDTKTAQIIDGTDKTLMPGLIDCHVHIQGLNNRSDKDSDAFLYGTMPGIFKERILPYGITTVKDLCAPEHFIYKLRDEIRKGKITGPELLVTGPNFTAPDGHPANTLGKDNPWIRREMAIEVATPEQVSEGIDRLKQAGSDFLKFTYQGGDYWYFDEKLHINRLDKSLMQQIISEGREKGLKTTAHVFYKEDVQELLEAGIYGIEHGVLDTKLDPDDPIIKLWKDSGARFVPTVNAMTYEKEPTRLPNSLHNLKILYDAGIPIAMGTDNMFEMMGGDVEHRELAYYVEAGLTPMEAIVLATKNGAEHLGISYRKGLVRSGMEADLILLDEDPAKNIANMQFIDKVFLKGKLVFSQNVIQSYDIPAYTYPEGVSAMRYERTDGKEEQEVIVSDYADKQQIVRITYRDGSEWARDEYTVDSSLSAMKWHYSRPSDNTDITAEKQDGYIHMTGTFKGKAQDKTFKISDGLWYQMMDMAMPAFIASSEKEIVFYSIGTGDNRGAMGLGEFAAKKEGEETVTVNGVSCDCVKISFVLTVFSWAWKGLYWYDKKTGQMVQSGEQAGGTKKITYTLKELK